ncbi:uncharacterized protein LOC111583053 isoform X1 [Amphiprion ocellaris]|uniref:uncharacterized protein LOC111583053 isoform X1 n=1 Tax=Amphiprion ocellaris TaxID=80972 RepID=UPI002410C0ED|nr:uncharacterized protein LOC111583053 isoform X1 [Amphiprion ocellaris]
MKICRNMIKMKDSVFLVMFLWILTVSRGDTKVSCVFMERCILPCSFQVADQINIRWHSITRDFNVHSFYYNQDQLRSQHQIYRDRTSLFKDQISTGNASLQLTGVTVQDEGIYQCYISTVNAPQISLTNLTVYAPVQDVNIQQVENRITCSSEGIYPQPELTWSTTPPSNINLLYSTTVQQNEQQLYSISSSLILSPNDTDLLYSCTISTPTNRRRAAWRKLSDEDSSHRLASSVSVGGIMITVVGPILVAAAAVGLCLYLTTKKGQQENNTRRFQKYLSCLPLGSRQAENRSLPSRMKSSASGLVVWNEYDYDLNLGDCLSGESRSIHLSLSDCQHELLSMQTVDLVEMEKSNETVNYPVTSILPTHQLHFSSSGPGGSPRGSSIVPGSVSMPSLSHITSAGNNKPTRAASLPDMKLQSSFEEFTPDLSEDDEGYRFQCSCPGLYQCSVTGLVFDMEGEGDVAYRTVPWNRRLLVQHHKRPAGPLFDIKCQQQSVHQLHLPHCQILPTAGFLAVAHVKDDGVEFITPHKITETHLVINIMGFSGFGIVKDEDSPPDPVRALVLLFYRPPDDPDVTSVLNVLMLPKNVSLRDVQRTRRKLVGDERYIETSPHCKLLPDQVYTLSTAPEDDSVLVQPTEAEFEEDSYDNYFPMFQVFMETKMKHMKLFLRDSSSQSVWERQVCLSSAGQIKSSGSNPPNQKLLDVRSCFIDGTSGPVLNSLLDKLLEKKVLTDSERESADEVKNRRDKARFVIDTVRKKGDAASSEMMEFFCELDPFLCEHLDLM